MNSIHYAITKEIKKPIKIYYGQGKTSLHAAFSDYTNTPFFNQHSKLHLLNKLIIDDNYGNQLEKKDKDGFNALMYFFSFFDFQIYVEYLSEMTTHTLLSTTILNQLFTREKILIDKDNYGNNTLVHLFACDSMWDYFDESEGGKLGKEVGDKLFGYLKSIKSNITLEESYKNLNNQKENVLFYALSYKRKMPAEIWDVIISYSDLQNMKKILYNGNINDFLSIGLTQEQINDLKDAEIIIASNHNELEFLKKDELPLIDDNEKFNIINKHLSENPSLNINQFKDIIDQQNININFINNDGWNLLMLAIKLQLSEQIISHLIDKTELTKDMFNNYSPSPLLLYLIFGKEPINETHFNKLINSQKSIGKTISLFNKESLNLGMKEHEKLKLKNIHLYVKQGDYINLNDVNSILTEPTQNNKIFETDLKDKIFKNPLLS